MLDGEIEEKQCNRQVREKGWVHVGTRTRGNDMSAYASVSGLSSIGQWGVLLSERGERAKR